MSLMHDDRELLDGFRAGDQAVLARVYQHYVGAVAAFIRNGFMYQRDGAPASFAGVRSPFELENVLQEVFARAFTEQARTSYDGLRPYLGFLCGIARNVILDQLRKSARRKEVIEAPESLERAAAPADHTPGESLDDRQAHVLVRQFLSDECDDRDRRLYELRFDRELSQQAAAEEAKLTRIQIRRWERKFKARLLRFLKRANYVR